MRATLLPVCLLAALPANAQQTDTVFERGQEIEMRTSADNGWRKCTVTDPGGSNRVARADCEEHPTPRYTYPAGEDNFNPLGSADVRLPGSCTTTSPYANLRAIPGCGAKAAKPGPAVVPPPPARATAPARPAAAPPRADRPAATGTGTLPLGEYGCIGAGTTQLAGMGTKLLPGGRYSDLEGREFGRYQIVGNTIRFTGGVLDGEVGRDIKDNGYNIGRMVSCQKW